MQRAPSQLPPDPSHLLLLDDLPPVERHHQPGLPRQRANLQRLHLHPRVKLDPLVKALRPSPELGRDRRRQWHRPVIDLHRNPKVLVVPRGIEAVEGAHAEQERLVDGDGLLERGRVRRRGLHREVDAEGAGVDFDLALDEVLDPLERLLDFGRELTLLFVAAAGNYFSGNFFANLRFKINQFEIHYTMSLQQRNLNNISKLNCLVSRKGRFGTKKS